MRPVVALSPYDKFLQNRTESHSHNTRAALDCPCGDHFAPIATDASLRYSYQYLNAADARFVEGYGVASARVGAVILDLRHDLRDNPITPRNGHKLFSTIEIASAALGGEPQSVRL